MMTKRHKAKQAARKAKRQAAHNLRGTRGYIVWEGKSRLDGAPLVAILTLKTKNRKTGQMAQLWILRSDIDPVAALYSGRAVSICGDCVLIGEGCYVNVGQAPLAVYRAFKRGIYPKFDATIHSDNVRGRKIRLGAYGDPAAIPYWVLRVLVHLSSGHTGYTHQHYDRRNWRYRRILMASVETDAQAWDATQRGWRYFRTRQDGDPVAPREIDCPAVRGISCADCCACDGSGANPKRVSISIGVHGSPSTRSMFKKVYRRLSE